MATDPDLTSAAAGGPATPDGLPAFGPVASAASATEQVFSALYDAVISLALPPGTKLSENDIARQFGVSRQPVRDAFFRLANLGFIQIRPQRGTLVTRISASEVREAAFIRTALERACVLTAVDVATEADLADLAALVAQQRAVRGDRIGFHTLDDAFHRRLCEAAGHARVWTVIRDHKAHMDRVRFLSLAFATDRALADHEAILAALRARDPARAEACMAAHLGHIEQIIQQVCKTHGQFFEDPA